MTDENTEPKTAGTEPTVPDWLLPNRAYDVLKWLALIVLPALAVFVHVVDPAWGLPYVDQIVTTLNALGTLIGAVIGASELKVRYSA